jgi:hypothetical protein
VFSPLWIFLIRRYQKQTRLAESRARAERIAADIRQRRQDEDAAWPRSQGIVN